MIDSESFLKIFFLFSTTPGADNSVFSVSSEDITKIELVARAVDQVEYRTYMRTHGHVFSQVSFILEEEKISAGLVSFIWNILTGSSGGRSLGIMWLGWLSHLGRWKVRLKLLCLKSMESNTKMAFSWSEDGIIKSYQSSHHKCQQVLIVLHFLGNILQASASYLIDLPFEMFQRISPFVFRSNYAWDLEALNSQMMSYSHFGTSNTDFEVFGKSVILPMNGRVLSAVRNVSSNLQSPSNYWIVNLV